MRVRAQAVGRKAGRVGLRRSQPQAGLATATGASDRGDLDLRIRGEERDPDTGILASDDVLAATRAIRSTVAEILSRAPASAGGAAPGFRALAGARACYNPEKDPDLACGRALVEALSPLG